MFTVIPWPGHKKGSEKNKWRIRNVRKVAAPLLVFQSVFFMIRRDATTETGELLLSMEFCDSEEKKRPYLVQTSLQKTFNVLFGSYSRFHTRTPKATRTVHSTTTSLQLVNSRLLNGLKLLEGWKNISVPLNHE